MTDDEHIATRLVAKILATDDEDDRVDVDQLRVFVEYHPDPTVAAVFEVFDADPAAVTEKSRDIVRRWVEQRRAVGPYDDEEDPPAANHPGTGFGSPRLKEDGWQAEQ